MEFLTYIAMYTFIIFEKLIDGSGCFTLKNNNDNKYRLSNVLELLVFINCHFRGYCECCSYLIIPSVTY